MDSKKKIIRRINKSTFEKGPSLRTISVLKKAWNELPSDFTFGERSLFIEVAERLIKIANNSEDKSN